MLNNRFWIIWDGAPRQVAIGGGDNEMVYVPELNRWIPWGSLSSRKEDLSNCLAVA